MKSIWEIIAEHGVFTKHQCIGFEVDLWKFTFHARARFWPIDSGRHEVVILFGGDSDTAFEQIEYLVGVGDCLVVGKAVLS